MIFAIKWGKDPLDFFVILVLTFVSVCIALVLHELAHGIVAKWNGDYTAKFAGRLTLNPTKHFDIVGLVMMMLIGFGYAKPVPVNPYNFKHLRKGLVTVAIAGVVTNLILAFFSALLFCLAQFMSVNVAIGGASVAAIRLLFYIVIFFKILTTVNLALVFFNILPIFPLDGFRVVEAFSRRGNRFCAFMRVNGQYILWGLVGLSFIVSSAMDRVALPSWFSYFDILGTYIEYFTSLFFGWFCNFWQLMVPVY